MNPAKIEQLRRRYADVAQRTKHEAERQACQMAQEQLSKMLDTHHDIRRAYVQLSNLMARLDKINWSERDADETQSD